MTADWTVLVDFDGTLTEVDADIFIAKALLAPQAYAEIVALFEAYESTQINLPTYFSKYLAVVDLDTPAFFASLDTVPIRHDLVSLIRSAATSTEVTILSEGLDAYMLPILSRLGLTEIPTVCNRVYREKAAVRIVPDPAAEPCGRCLSCKGAFVRRKKSGNPNLKTLLIGNGASDLCAAKEADVVFARDSLLAGCEKQNIPFHPWSTARDIEGHPAWQRVFGLK